MTYVSLDVETTGFDIEKDKIIEIGAVKFKEDKIVDKFQMFINPGVAIPEIITHITGIKETDTGNAKRFSEIKEELQKFIGKAKIVGHNIKFDMDFLAKEGLQMENGTLDTFGLSQLLIEAPAYSLETLTDHLKIPHEEKHRALSDSIACMYLFNILLKEIEKIPIPLLEEIKLHVAKSDWALGELFMQASGSDKADSPEKTEEIANSQVKTNKELTEKILEAFENGKNLLCEAGIGSQRKKSLLSVATTQAKKNQERIVISVYNKNSTKELLEISDVKTVVLESHGNYLSTKRLNLFKEKERFENDEITLLIKILLQKDKTKYCEKSEFSLNREEKILFDHVSCDLLECNHDDKETKDACFFSKAHEKAIDADIIITTHDFLLGKNGDMIPPYRYLIIDEADYLDKAGIIVETLVPEIMEKKYAGKNPDMLFGLIGIFFEKYRDKDDSQLVMSEYHYRVMDWRNICKTAAKIDESLKEIFTEEWSEKKVNWIFQNINGGICFKSAQIDVKERLQNIIEKKKSVILASETLQIDNSFSFIRDQLGLYENFDEFVYKSRVSSEEKINVEMAPRDFPQNNTEGYTQKCANYIIEKAIKNGGNMIVLFTSFKAIEACYKLVAPKLKEREIMALAQGMTGGAGKIIDTFRKRSGAHVLLCTFDFWENCRLPEANCLVITKLPFEHLGNPIFMARKGKYQNDFIEYSLPKALLNFSQAVHKLIKSSKGDKTVAILDTRVTQKEYGKKFLETIPKTC